MFLHQRMLLMLTFMHKGDQMEDAALIGETRDGAVMKTVSVTVKNHLSG